jgi:hypothetical protein
MHDKSGGAHGSGSTGGGAVAEAVRLEPLSTVPLSEKHRIDAFRCDKSGRISSFFARECPELTAKRYCRVFVLPSPEDPTHIFGYYSLSPSILTRSRATGSDQKRIPLGLPIPMCLIGFMGRCDSAPKGIGESLIVDAARRAFSNEDIVSWGLMLDAEGGPENQKLWEWYKAQGFIPAKDEGKPSGVMYGAHKKFIPELTQQHAAANIP